MPYITFNQILTTESQDYVEKFNYINNTRNTLFFNAFELLPDPNFVLDGDLYITKNGITVFDSTRNNQPLQRYSRFPVRAELITIARDEEFKIFVKSKTADMVVSVSISLELDYEDIPLPSTLVPLPLDDLNPNVTNVIDRNTQFQLTKLDSIQTALTALPQNNNDVTEKLTEVKNTIGNLPQNNNDIVSKLTEVNTSVNDISIAAETIPKAILDLDFALTVVNNSAAYNAKLTLLRTGLVNLRDGFDLVELENLIDNLILNLPDVRTNDQLLGLLLDSLLINLELAAKNINEKVTINSNLFSFESRYNSDESVLFNLKNSRNLVVSVNIERKYPSSPYTLAVDGSLSNYVILPSNQDSNVITSSVFDFGSIQSRIFSIKGQTQSNTGEYVKIQVRSNLTDSWADMATIPTPAGHSGNVVLALNFKSIETSFRYARIIFTSYELLLFEIWDSKESQGSAKLSLEIKTVDGNWVTHLPYTDFGIIYFNSATFTKNIDSILSFIPSSDSNVRFRLISTGGLKIGISALRFN